MGALPIEHVVPGEGYSGDGFGELHLEHHQILAPKGNFRSDEVHLPHPTKTLVIDRSNAVAISLETPAPRAEGLCVVQAQDFEIGDPEAQPLDGRQYLRKRRNITARKDVFSNPRIGRSWPVLAADRVQQRDAVRGEQRFQLVEEAAVMIDPDV